MPCCLAVDEGTLKFKEGKGRGERERINQSSSLKLALYGKIPRISQRTGTYDVENRRFQTYGSGSLPLIGFGTGLAERCRGG